MKLNATATAILAGLGLAAIVALTAAHIPVPSELSYIVTGLVGGHLGLAVPGGGTVTITSSPTAAIQTAAAAEPVVVAAVKAAEAPTPQAAS